MLSLDEPLDLKLPSGRTNGRMRLGKRSWSSSICAPLSAMRPRLLRTTFPSPPSSPDSQSPSLERPGSCFTPPAMDLSMSPSSHHPSSPTPSSPSSPSPYSPRESVHSSGSPLPQLLSRDSSHARYPEGGSSPQGYQFYMPIGSPAGGYNFPPSMFIGQKSEKRASPEEPQSDEQLACHWMKCHLQFDSLQDLVDHINDFHVKPEKDSGYCCQWEGCARNGRGFNARYKMLIHIRTHTNEKPHHCPTCNKSFSRLENLKIHTRSHTGEKPYICPYEGCSKRYSNSSDRFKHTRTHYVDKPYYCKMAGCLKRYTDPSSLRKHIKAHGHFVAAQEHHHHGSPGRLMAAGLGLQGLQGAAELPYLSGAHIIIPGAAAATLLGGMGGTSLPISALCHARALGHHHHGPSLFSLGDSSPLLPFGLSAASMLGLGALHGLGRLQGSRGKVEGEREAEEGGEAESEEGEALNLSSGVGERRGGGPLSWVVVPPGALLLKPAVVSQS